NYLSSVVGVVSGSNTSLESLETTFHQDLNGDGVIGLPPLPTTAIESSGATSLVQVGTNYFLDPVAGGTGPELKYGGTAVTAGEFGGWTPIGAEQTANGFDIAWKVQGGDQYTVWSTDPNGNYLSSVVGVVSGSNTSLESLETTFHQDLNGDGIIGLPPLPTTAIESSGSTSLVQVGTNYFLDPVAGGTGPELKYGGTAVTAGQFGGWTPIGAEQTANGFDIAWKVQGGDQYTVWSTDPNGNYLSSVVGVVSGSNTSLESLETTFHQDLNGDGIIGLPPLPTTAIESSGSTSLVQVGTNYFLDPVAGGTGPELKYGGTAVTAGQFGGWTPIGAEQTANGFDIAWKVQGGDQYTVWSTDPNGNYLSSVVGVVSGSNTSLESLETTFHQDLNGDGIIGLPPLPTTAIESSGATSLVQVGTNYFLDPVAGGTGPELKYGGTAVTAGEFGGWTPIGAEQTANGFDIAWKVQGSDQYTVWSTDPNGNYLSSVVGVVSGSNTSLESLETTFHQDLNGDGIIGLPPLPTTAIESSGSTSLVEVGTNYFLDPVAGGTGPELKYGGTAVTAGQFGGWTPIGAEQTANGFDIAWKVQGSDQYTVWSTDPNGNYVSNVVGVVSGSNTSLESVETTFHQDLNGDGIIGLPPLPTTAIESSGSTSLVQVGTNYFLDPVAGGTGPELKYGGTAVTAGQFGGCSPYTTHYRSNGFDIAWKVQGGDQYTVW